MKKTPSCVSDPQLVELSQALSTLSDPNRLRIMCFLSRGEQCVCHVERQLGISQQLASHHLNVLRDAGFLNVRKKGTWSHYSINGGALKHVNTIFLKYLNAEGVSNGKDEAVCCQR
jgi:ArsR family transcriptional regulator